MQTDYAQRFIFEGKAIRGEIVRLQRSYHAISQQRLYPEAVLRFLGQTLVANVLLSTTLKYEGQITMQMQQQGPLRLLVAQCNNQLHIRGVAQWDDVSTDSVLSESIQAGQLVITVQPNNRTDIYQSVVDIDHQPIAQVMEHYFLQSEQLPTRLWLAADQQMAAGLLLQQVGDVEGDPQQKQAIWEEVNILTSTLTTAELLHLDAETLLHRLYHEYDLRLFSQKPVEFRCGCTVAKMEAAILIMGREEAIKLLNESKKIIVKCEYCNYEYVFSEDEVRTLLAVH